MKGLLLGHLEGIRGRDNPSQGGGWRVFTRLSSSGSSLKKGLCSCSCWWTKFSMSTSKLADVMHSEPWVACSHFSNSSVRSGKRGCLRGQRELTHVHPETCCLQGFLQCRSLQGPISPSHHLFSQGPTPGGRPRSPLGQQHVIPWHRGSNLLIPGASVASVPPLPGV